MKIRTRATKAGFTLVELLVVIFIIAILMGLVFGITGVATRKSAEAQALADMELIRGALEEYRLERGSYLDETDVDFQVITNYTDEAISFTDPWGNSYAYERLSPFVYELISVGADGTKGTADDVTTTSK